MPPKKESFMAERYVSQEELVQLRAWQKTKVESRNCWAKLPPGETTAKVRLYIHELFILKSYREKHALKAMKAITITEENKKNYQHHLEFACIHVKTGFDEVEAMEDGQEKENLMIWLRWNEMWLQHVAELLGIVP